MKINLTSKSRGFLITGLVLLVYVGNAAGQTLTMDSTPGQSVFSTPELAAQTLVKAVADHDEGALDKILGADHKEVLSLDGVDPEDRDNFLAAWSKSNTLIAEGDRQRLLAVGENDWTLPIPIVKNDSGWYFDVDAGAERMRIRRIGRNELAAIQSVLAYYDAQMEFAEQDRNGNGGLEYAQLLKSSPGKHDGLFWESTGDEPSSPLGRLFVETSPQDAYHGYRYKILKSQGEHAPGGAYAYVVGKRMIGGFALVAWPVEYGDSGVMSFIVSHSGTVYEQDLGPDGAALASVMESFDPSADWRPVQEVHGPKAEAK